MNTLIANQYGRVQGEAGGCGLTLCVTAQTPRRESVELQTRVDSIEQQLHLLAILRAVDPRIEQFQLRDSKAGESAEQRSFRDHLRRRGSVPLERFAIEEQHLWALFSVYRLRAGGAGPAYQKPGSTLVDLRMFDPDDRSANPRLVFRPEKLRALGIPYALIEAAAKSDPQGFLLFDDLPNQVQQASGHATKPQPSNRQPESWRCAMREETQNSMNLKLIMYFDPEDQTFAIWDHNLAAEEASRESDRIRRKGLPAFTVEQRSRHKAEEAEDCGDCPAEVEHAINAIPGHSEPEPGSPKRQL